jgi:hypothetical protein
LRVVTTWSDGKSARRSTHPHIDATLGEHAKILDQSIAGMTAREIAQAMGGGQTKQAERKAVAAQDAALAALTDVEKLAA